MHNIMFKSVSLYLCLCIRMPWITSKKKKYHEKENGRAISNGNVANMCLLTSNTTSSQTKSDTTTREILCLLFFLVLLVPYCLIPIRIGRQSKKTKNQYGAWCMVHFNLHSFALSVLHYVIIFLFCCYSLFELLFVLLFLTSGSCTRARRFSKTIKSLCSLQ